LFNSVLLTDLFKLFFFWFPFSLLDFWSSVVDDSLFLCEIFDFNLVLIFSSFDLIILLNFIWVFISSLLLLLLLLLLLYEFSLKNFSFNTSSFLLLLIIVLLLLLLLISLSLVEFFCNSFLTSFSFLLYFSFISFFFSFTNLIGICDILLFFGRSKFSSFEVCIFSIFIMYKIWIKN